MDVVVKKNTVEFSGLLNEDSSSQTIQEALEIALKNSIDKFVNLDFSRVKRANSCGILAWYRILEPLEGKFIYINVPRWLVEQFNISDFLNEKTEVKSIEANFYCPENDTHENIILELSKDIPILDNYENFNIVLKNKEGLDLEMDFEPSEYFYFLTVSIHKTKEGQSN